MIYTPKKLGKKSWCVYKSKGKWTMVNEKYIQRIMVTFLINDRLADHQEVINMMASLTVNTWDICVNNTTQSLIADNLEDSSWQDLAGEGPLLQKG
jgi:hypothetical protein